MPPRCPVCGATAARGLYSLPRFSWLGALERAEATKHARERFGLDVRTGDSADFAADGRSFDAITWGTSSGPLPW